MPPGAASDVGNRQPAHRAEKFGKVPFLQRDQRIAVAIVKVRPAIVPLASIDDLDARIIRHCDFILAR